MRWRMCTTARCQKHGGAQTNHVHVCYAILRYATPGALPWPRELLPRVSAAVSDGLARGYTDDEREAAAFGGVALFGVIADVRRTAGLPPMRPVRDAPPPPAGMQP